MAISQWHLTRFERILFRTALILAGLILAVRIVAVIIMFCLPHSS
jgi:hypothetical protein